MTEAKTWANRAVRGSKKGDEPRTANLENVQKAHWSDVSYDHLVRQGRNGYR